MQNLLAVAFQRSSSKSMLFCQVLFFVKKCIIKFAAFVVNSVISIFSVLFILLFTERPPQHDFEGAPYQIQCTGPRIPSDGPDCIYSLNPGPGSVCFALFCWNLIPDLWFFPEELSAPRGCKFQTVMQMFSPLDWSSSSPWVTTLHMAEYIQPWHTSHSIGNMAQSGHSWLQQHTTCFDSL